MRRTAVCFGIVLLGVLVFFAWTLVSGPVDVSLRDLALAVFSPDEAEPDPLRYTAAPPPVDARDAYNEPYIPPQWKSPEPVGIRKKRSEKEKQDDA